MAVRCASQSVKKGGGPECEQSFLATLDFGGHFLFEGANGEVALDAWATANLVCSRCLAARDRLLVNAVFSRVLSHPACARSKLGDGAPGKGRDDVDFSAGSAGTADGFTAFALEACNWYSS